MTAVVTPEIRTRLILRLRALMSRTVANGCTVDEELAAARMVAKLMEQIEAAEAPPPPPAAAEQVRAERQSPEYQALLERTTLEGLLKAAIQELALNHINTVSPPSRKIAGQPVQWVRVPEMLDGHFAMMLGLGGSRLGRDIIARTVEELIQDGLLPAQLGIPLAY